jgi:hypothetical protein
MQSTHANFQLSFHLMIKFPVAIHYTAHCDSSKGLILIWDDGRRCFLSSVSLEMQKMKVLEPKSFENDKTFSFLRLSVARLETLWQILILNHSHSRFGHIRCKSLQRILNFPGFFIYQHGKNQASGQILTRDYGQSFNLPIWAISVKSIPGLGCKKQYF